MSEKLSDLMFQFIVDKGLRSEWDIYFEKHESKSENKTFNEKIISWDDGGCSTGMNKD